MLTEDREGSVLLAFILSLQAVIYTYDGWSGVIYFSEEVHDPGRDIPRAMFGGVISVTIIYLLMNVAAFAVVGRVDLMVGTAAVLLAVSGGRVLRAMRRWDDPVVRAGVVAVVAA